MNRRTFSKTLRDSCGRPIRWSPMRARVSICAGAARAGTRSSRSRSDSNHKGGHLAFGPTDFSTSASATAAPAATPAIARRTQQSCWANFCASTSMCPTEIRSGTRCPLTIRSSRRVRPVRATEIWSFGWRNPVAVQLRRSRARRHGRAHHRRRRTGHVGRN